MKRVLFALLVFFIGLAIAPRALAFVPPPMTAHVTDTAGKLSESERLAIDKKLEDYRLRTGNEIAVFLPKSLEGESVEEVAFTTGRTWHVGVKGQDNGVLLVIAPAERRSNISVGKGAEGALTDLQADDILRQKIAPHLAPGHEDWAGAVEDATDAIMADLDKGGSASAPARKPASPGDVLFGLLLLAFVIGIPILFFVLLLRGLGRAFTSNGRSAYNGWASGSSWSSDSSWSPSPNDSSWSSSSSSDSSFSSGDSGYTGGGGDFGGGGASGSF